MKITKKKDTEKPNSNIKKILTSHGFLVGIDLSKNRYYGNPTDIQTNN